MYHRRGSALIMILIVALVVTALVFAMAWVAGQNAKQTSNLNKVDGAACAAEAGAQRVAWYCKNKKMSSISSPLTGSLNGYSYSVTWTSSSGSIQLTSVGSFAGISYTLSETLTPPTPAPAIAAGGDFDNKNIDVTGNVIIGGTYTNGGNGTITGDLAYYTNASNTNSISGNVSHYTGTFSAIDMTTLGDTLIAAAGKTYSGNQDSTTFDFTALSGTHKVIYVAGNVTNPAFLGSGTLYVAGSVSAGSFGTSANPVNIVASGDVTSSNNITVYGSIYTGGSWSRGKFSLTGMVYAGGTVVSSNYAQSTLTMSSIPWFDPRSTSWSTTTTIRNFSGPQP